MSGASTIAITAALLFIGFMIDYHGRFAGALEQRTFSACCASIALMGAIIAAVLA